MRNREQLLFSLAILGGILLANLALGFEFLLPEYLLNLGQKGGYATAFEIVTLQMSFVTVLILVAFVVIPRRTMTHALVVSCFAIVSIGFNFIAHVVSVMDREQITSETPDFSSGIVIESSTFELTVTCDGSGVLKRTRILTPTVPTNRLFETDFYMRGGISAEDFQTSIHELIQSEFGVDHTREIPCFVENFDEYSFRLVTRIGGAMELIPGRRYKQTTEIFGEGAYVNQDADGLTIVLNHPTRFLDCRIEFRNGCLQQPDRMRVMQLKRSGSPLRHPVEIPVIVNTSSELRARIIEPLVGDQYGIFWEYDVPPDTTYSD